LRWPVWGKSRHLTFFGWPNPRRRASGLWNFTVNNTTTIMELPPDFKEILQLLGANGVEYLIIGGFRPEE
jgi:hypothetical protein